MELEELPQPEYEGTAEPDGLHTDGDNPNEMTDEQFGLLCDRMRENGWLGGHIITDTDGLIADGEHRWRAAQEIGLSEVPVRQYEIDDATRRLWRQELNKIHGEHDKKRDALEYDELLSEGYTEEVEELTDAADEDLDELLAELRVDNGVGPEYEYDPEHNVYFEDCVEGMRERLDDDSVDMVFTDPPYGIDMIQDGKVVGEDNVAERQDVPKFEGDEEYDFLPVWNEIQRIADTYVIWGGNYFTDILPPTNSWLVWDKRAGRSTYNSDCEFAWTNLPTAAKVYDYTWSGMIKESADRNYPHANQRPVGLYKDIIRQFTEPGDLVCDPYMGSGTTAIACIETNRDYVGFELDEENYRPIIEQRIGEAKRQKQATVNEDE